MQMQSQGLTKESLREYIWLSKYTNSVTMLCHSRSVEFVFASKKRSAISCVMKSLSKAIEGGTSVHFPSHH